MYTGNKNVRVTVRISPQQFSFVKSNSDMLGITPAEFLRMIINLAMSQQASDRNKH